MEEGRAMSDLRDGLALALCRKQCSLPGMIQTCECPDPASDPEYPICIQWLAMADACIEHLAALQAALRPK
jgi:hypothetical protein